MAQASPPPGQNKIAEEAWEQAHTTLVFYFSHHGGVNPNDLAQETLARLVEWLGRGNKIDGDSGFQKLCYGFARNVLRESNDRRIKQSDQLDSDVATAVNKTWGLNSNETAIFVTELLALLSSQDRELILAAELMDPALLAQRFGTSVSNVNLKVFRARERLRKLANSQRGSAGKP